MKLRSIFCIAVASVSFAASAITITADKKYGRIVTQYNAISNVLISLCMRPCTNEIDNTSAYAAITNLISDVGLSYGDFLLWRYDKGDVAGSSGSGWYSWMVTTNKQGVAHWKQQRVSTSVYLPTSVTTGLVAYKYEKRGHAVWIYRSINSAKRMYLCGQSVDTCPSRVIPAGGSDGPVYTLVGYPIDEVFDLYKFNAAGILDGDTVLIPSLDNATGRTEYVRDGGVWKKWTTSTDTVTNPRTGETDTITTSSLTPITSGEVSLGIGHGFLYGRQKGAAKFTINENEWQ